MKASGWVLAAAIAAGVSYMASWGLPMTPAASLAWKGAGVGLLAVFAASTARDIDGWLLAAALALGAAGDVVIETSGLAVGGAVFFAGHVAATSLYLRNRRPSLRAPGVALAAAIGLGVVALAYLLPLDRVRAPQAAAYAIGLAAMAATASLSRFPRQLTALGALMFAASDLLLFAKAGRPFEHALWAAIAVWGLYFAGQALIALGGVRGLADRAEAQAGPLAA